MLHRNPWPGCQQTGHTCQAPLPWTTYHPRQADITATREHVQLSRQQTVLCSVTQWTFCSLWLAAPSFVLSSVKMCHFIYEFLRYDMIR